MGHCTDLIEFQLDGSMNVVPVDGYVIIVLVDRSENVVPMDNQCFPSGWVSECCLRGQIR